MTDYTPEALEALAQEYRLTMDKDIVHSWAGDAARALADIADALRTGQLILAQPSDPWEGQAELLDECQKAASELDCQTLANIRTLTEAQPSGDEVEAVALAILNSDRGMRGLDPLESRENVPDSDGYVTNATAAITALDAVRGKQ